MNLENNNVLLAVTLMERIEPLLSINTRESIPRIVCSTIKRNYKVFPYSKDSEILIPILESVELLDFLCDNEGFVETDYDTKTNLIRLYQEALGALYLFAGKFYEGTEFRFSLGISDVLRRIVDFCVDSGYYFGIDKELNLSD